MTTENDNSEAAGPDSTVVRKPVCGLVMPISAIDGCSEQHWSEVRGIISDAVDSVGFAPSLVSEADDIGIIQKRIIQNLYENPMVVCDVSCKNPNVMFELGVRLAFDKPTVIVKDDETAYNFDTSLIEHIPYPRDLRFGRIVEFKNVLAAKVRGTFERATADKNYTTFLKNFGPFSVATLETKEISADQFIIEQLNDIRNLVAKLTASGSRANSDKQVQAIKVSKTLAAAITVDVAKRIVENSPDLEGYLLKIEIINAVREQGKAIGLTGDDLQKFMADAIEYVPDAMVNAKR